MYLLSFEQRHAAGHRACPCIGGGSKSTSTTATNNYDQRKVTDTGGGANAQVDGSGNSQTIVSTTTDLGAVKAGADVSLAAIGANATNTDHLLNTVEHFMDTQKSVVDLSATLADSLAARTQGQSSGGLATNSTINTNTLALAAVAAAAVIAFAAHRGKL